MIVIFTEEWPKGRIPQALQNLIKHDLNIRLVLWIWPENVKLFLIFCKLFSIDFEV